MKILPLRVNSFKKIYEKSFIVKLAKMTKIALSSEEKSQTVIKTPKVRINDSLARIRKRVNAHNFNWDA